MIRARTSVASLLVFVGLMSVGFAALRVSSRLWANAMFSLAFGLLLVAVAGSIYRRGGVRAFCAGSALFGWAYFLATLGPSPLNALRDSMITTPLLIFLEAQMLEDVPVSPPGMARGLVAPTRRSSNFVELSPWSHWTATDRSNPFSSDSFNKIGHSLFCIGVALAGGVLCLRWQVARDAVGAGPPDRSSVKP